MNYNKIIGAIEIGTSKVVVLVGEIIGGSSLNIIGIGQSTSMGVRKGEISNFRAASDSTHAAIIAAEKNAGATIEAVYLAQTGAHLEGFSDKGAVTVSSPENIVCRADINQAVANAKRKELSAGRTLIHHVKNGFFLDGREVDDPLAMKGEKIEAKYWHVHGDEKKISDHIHVINGFGLEVEDMIISSIASGSIVADETEKENGVVVVDIGCGSTDFARYGNGNILCTGVIPVGGAHFTNDLSLGLRVGPKYGEKMKCEYGHAVVDPDKKSDQVWLFGDFTIGDRAIPKQAIGVILNARGKELFQILKKEMGDALSRQGCPCGVILTGGGSRLPNLTELAASVLDVPVRRGQNPTWVQKCPAQDLQEQLRGPEFSTVLGLLYYGLSGQSSRDDGKRSGLMKKLARIFKPSSRVLIG